MPKSSKPIEPRAACILYAEDEEDDILFLRLALKRAKSAGTLNVVTNGEEAVQYLDGRGVFGDRARYPLPALVLLDINMPMKSGLEVLKWIREQPRFKSLPVVMLTSSMRDKDMEEARRLGADDFLFKPSAPGGLDELVRVFHKRWLG